MSSTEPKRQRRSALEIAKDRADKAAEKAAAAKAAVLVQQHADALIELARELARAARKGNPVAARNYFWELQKKEAELDAALDAIGAKAPTPTPAPDSEPEPDPEPASE